MKSRRPGRSRRTRIDGQFSAREIKMLESAPFRVLSLSARRALDRLEIELAHLYGPAARCKPKVMIWRSWSCASVSGLLTEPLNSWPSWISARVRSHSRLGPEGQMGHLITNALARPFSISFSDSQTLAGKPTITFGISLSRQPSAW